MLYSFRYLARTQAFRTNLDVFYSAVFIYFDRLNICIPFAPSVAVGVRHIVAACLALSANRTLH